MKKLLVVSIFAYFHISTFAYCAPAPYGRFEDGMLSKTRPAGWLEGTCRVQSEGLTGHPEALSYPYDTCLWAGSIPRMGTHGSDWWRYEQTAYYTDGLLRLGYALGDKAFVEKGEAGVGHTLENASPEGYLGSACLWDSKKFKLKRGYDMWPFAVFFRAMKAKYDAAPDERIPAALARYFLLFDKKHVSEFRNVVNVEGMLWAYSHTGDKRLLELAEEAWRMRKPLPPNKKNELAPENCANDDAIHMHGVSYCEEMKVPMILAAYTGKKEYLDQAVNVERKLVRDHMLPDGCPSSTERVRGNSVHWGHETCDVADYTWSLGYFLETTGDASYADKIERCVFNAGFGAVSDDFRALQYFSNPNQFICTSNSDNNPHNYGTTWMQYRPTHETECCAGNVHRIVPNYISRMWLKDAKGRPVAALYGPSEVDYGWAKIKEETRYPFDGKITFRFSVKEPTDSAFTYRVPSWCKGGASVTVNGERGTSAAPGKFETIERKFKDGDVIELDFPMEVRFEELPRRFVVDNKDVKRGVKRPAEKFANASQGTVVTRGPLLFAYPIPTERTEDTEEHANMNGKKSANPDFKCWNMRPAGPFNYALAAHEAEVVQQSDAVGDGFFKNPGAIKLRVKVRRIKWTLDENRFTPDIPENPVVLDGAEETIELVPYGATMLRLGVFPDVTSKPHLYMAGDSIMADYKPGEWPQYGWGQALKAFMKDPSALHNFARSGWSARRFRESGRWEDCIASKLKPGDWVIVSFGHNDSNKKRNMPPKNDYSTPEEYKAFLKGFAADALAKGANIAFATSIAHSDGFSETNGVMRVDGGARGLGPYVAAMREVAAELGLSLLDLNRYAEKNLPKMGMEAAKSLYMFVEPGEYANYPNGKRDAAHIRDKGAFFYAKGAVEMARKQGLPIADVWKDPASVPFAPAVAPVPPVQAMAAKASAPSGKGGESVKVMTYNIRYSAGDKNSADNNWEARRDDLANLVESANPDVAGFQEVLPDQRKWLEARFPGYAFVGDGRNADRVHGEASPIAFRKDRFEPAKSGTFWLSETPDVPGSKSWEAAFPRICSYAVLKDRATGRTFAFANAHTDHKSEEAREKGMLLVIERMKEFSGDAPVVFVGDHNCLEYEKPAKAVAKLLKDAMYISETPPEGSWRTFNYWSYKGKEQTIVEALAKPVRERSIPGGDSDSKRIDYIYVSPGTRVLAYRTIAATRPGKKNLYPSDHFPSVAEVVLGATPATPYEVQSPGSAKLVFDTSNAPDLRKWTEEKFAPAMCEWVVKLTDIMASDGWEPPKDILFKFVVEPLQWDTNAPAWASSTEGRVSLRVDWFRANLNGEALGATIHELAHIMQAYWSKGQNKDNCPGWAVEGYADYIRWILFEPEADGCGYVRKNIKKYHYNDSYRVTAHFFGFVESRYPGTMKKLNAAMRDHTFDNDKFWQDVTGKTAEELEADWKSDVVVAATTPKVEDFKVKLTGVAIMPTDDDEEDEGKAKVLPPQTRIVVTPGNLAVFFLEYSFPPNVKSRMYLGPNFDEGVLGEDPFGTSASGLLSGKGKITKIVLLGAGGDEPYEKDLLLKSVKICGELEAKEGAPRNNSFFICDMPVDILFANNAESDGKGAVVLPPKPAPAPDPKLGVVPFDKNAKPKSSTPKGFTDNLDEALAKAKKEGKFVYVCFSGSDWCGWCKMLEREVFAQPEFVPAVEKDYLLVFIDSPSNKGVLSARAKKENPKLVKKYGITGFPIALILDGDGNKVGETGYRKGGAKAYVEHLLDIKGKRQVP